MASTLNSKFANKAKAAAPANVKKSIYAGIQASAPREPIPAKGQYTLKVLRSEEGCNPGKGTTSFKTWFEIVEIHDGGQDMSVGQVVIVPFVVEGTKAAPQNRSRVKAMVMGCAGYDDEAAYDEFDPDGLFIEACQGKQNDRSDEVAEKFVDRLVYCQIEKGKLIDGGPDYFREYAWASVDDQ